MTKRRLFSKAQIQQAARLASEHGVTVRLCPDGSMVIQPAAPSRIVGSELDRWRDEERNRSIPPWDGPKLTRNQELVLEQLAKLDGQPIAASGVAGAGPRTIEGLLAHGLVALEDDKKPYDRRQEIRATAEGTTHLKRRAAHFKKYPSL